MKHGLSILILLAGLLPLAAEPVYYRSNWVGIAMEPINRVRLDEFEYVLAVDRSGDTTIKTLYRKQKAWKRWEIVADSRGRRVEEREYENNALTSRSTFDHKGRVKIEYRYIKAALDQRLVYAYSARGVDFVVTYDAHDTLLYTDEYQLAPSGRLRSMRRVFPDDSVAVIHFTYGESIMVGEWEYRNGRVLDTQYNGNGQAQHREEWDGDTLLSVKDYEYDPQTGALTRETEKHLDDGTQHVSYYDGKGNLTRETEGKNNEPPVELSYGYQDGRRISTRKKSSIGVEEWKFNYNAEGKLTSEEYYRRGFLQMRTVYTDPDSWYEEIFHDDEVIIRVYFVKEKKIREEFLQDGQVVRTREY